MSGAARIKYRSGEEYIHGSIAEQMAEALRWIDDEDTWLREIAGDPNCPVVNAEHTANVLLDKVHKALAAYEQAKGEEKE